MVSDIDISCSLITYVQQGGKFGDPIEERKI